MGQIFKHNLMGEIMSNNSNTNISIFSSPVKVYGDYQTYRTWFLQATIKTGSRVSLKLRSSDSDKDSGSTCYFETEDQLRSFLAKSEESLVIASKDFGATLIDAYDNKDEHISDLLSHLGIAITERGYANPQKLTKRLKRVFRQTRYGFHVDPIITKISDPEGYWDGLGLISLDYIQSLGISAQEYDRFSFTILSKDGCHKGHFLAMSGLRYNIMLFDNPWKELSYGGKTFLQLEPVSISSTPRMGVQTLSGLLMTKKLKFETVFSMIEKGFAELEKELVAPMKKSDNPVDYKLGKMEFAEVSVLFPRVVSMRWTAERKALTDFSKMRFPLPSAIKGYLAPNFVVEQGFPKLIDDDQLIYKFGNLMVGKKRINSVKATHGGADWDDAVTILPTDNSEYLVWRNPNYYKELATYKINF